MQLPSFPFTATAYAAMQQEVQELEQEEREVIERLKIAREQGDLSENGAYKYAKFELGRVRRELGRLRRLLEYGYIVEAKKSYDQVEFGCFVTVQTQGKETTFQLVSKHESDPAAQKLSQESPIGQALLHRKVGEVVAVQTPRGVQEYTLVRISAESAL